MRAAAGVEAPGVDGHEGIGGDGEAIQRRQSESRVILQGQSAKRAALREVVACSPIDDAPRLLPGEALGRQPVRAGDIGERPLVVE